jgi:N-glycosylase/DNA lyase
MNREVKGLIAVYKKQRSQIKKRLAEFKSVGEKGGKKLFVELCFCLCTPQSKAVNCNEAVRRLGASSKLFKGSPESVAKHLKGLVRFHNNKAKYIVEARQKLCNAPMQQDPAQIRSWLVENIKGLGMKEASHFLRNIGFGNDLAIIDRHILTNLKKYDACAGFPRRLTYQWPNWTLFSGQAKQVTYSNNFICQIKKKRIKGLRLPALYFLSLFRLP